MNQFIPLTIGVISLALGSVLGYYARQTIARRNAETIEAKIQKKISQTKAEAESIISQAKEKAALFFDKAKKEIDGKREDLFRTEKLLLKREDALDKKFSDYEQKTAEFRQKVAKLKELKENLDNLKKQAGDNLEKISGYSREQAKKELFKNLEDEHQKDIFERIKKLEREGWEGFEKKAKELIALAIQKYALSQAQDITTTTLNLPSEEIKGRIIGKEGRNIRVFEKLTGVEVIIDETPETVIISGFDPVRRQVAKMALERLIKDGRIQPARIEEIVSWAEAEISSKIKEMGEQAIYEVGVVGLDPKLAHLLGRLYFRTSYGQNVLLHSIEVSLLAGTLAAELGTNVILAKKAGLLHDIGKAVDHHIEGSHVDIGIKILEKFGQDKEVIEAMKSHHEEYPYSNIEAILIQTADQISGARPGARKDTLENYLKRLGELESIANSFSGVEKSYAIQAGRELRVFVKPQEVNDLGAIKMAKEIAARIQDELRYPGEIKVIVIRENRVVEYAK